MLIGIVLSTIVITVLGAFFASNILSYVLGTLLGGCFAAIVLVMLYRSIEKALMLDEENASKHTTKTAIFRLIIMCIALMAGILFPGILNVVGVFLGLMSLKFCAYLQPSVHKVLALKNIDKGR
ncbi:MAG: ATP synthase subunit I [bacterium]|nr:ATP synthase subunit I [bacterium]